MANQAGVCEAGAASPPTTDPSQGDSGPRLVWTALSQRADPPPAALPAAAETHPAPRGTPRAAALLPLDAAPPRPSAAAAPPNRLFHGDNLGVMSALRPEFGGRIDLIYVDPPFASDADYVVRQDGVARAAYSDRWTGGLRGYLDMLAPRLRLMRDLLAPHGSFYIHLDASAVHYVKVLLDEIYGLNCFQREIIWRIGWISGYKSAVRNWVRNHDTILFYTKHPKEFTFHKAYVPHLPGYSRRGGKEGKGHPMEDVWNANAAEAALTGAASLDSIQIKSFSSEKTGFETQKNESLLRRIIEASSNPGDLVADFFCGSGTTLAVADRLGRRWIGCDAGAPAIEVTRRRLLALPERAAFDLYVVDGEGGGPPAGDEAAP